MPLITKIVKPERFTAMDIANAILEKLGHGDAEETERRRYINAVAFALADFVQLGILSCGKEFTPIVTNCFLDNIGRSTEGKKKERKKKP
jgi:hypothetical protein